MSVEATTPLSSHQIEVIRTIDTSSIPTERDGSFWKCIAEIILENGDRLFRFQLRGEFNHLKPGASLKDVASQIQSVLNTMFPAIEMLPEDLYKMLTKFTPTQKRAMIVKDFAESIIDKYARYREEKKVIPDNALLYSLRTVLKSGDLAKKIVIDLKKKWMLISFTENPDILSNKKRDLMKVLDQALPGIFGSDSSIVDLTKKHNENVAILNRVGIEFIHQNNDWFLTYPDPLTLQKRWDSVSQEYHLPKITVITSDQGIEGDQAFIEAHTKGDFLVTSKAENPHDMTAHALARLWLILKERDSVDFSYADYIQKFKLYATRLNYLINFAARMKTETNDMFITSDELEMLSKLLGAIVDSLSATSDRDLFILEQRNPVAVAEHLLQIPSWKMYFQNKLRSFHVRGSSSNRLINLLALLIRVQNCSIRQAHPPLGGAASADVK